MKMRIKLLLLAISIVFTSQLVTSQVPSYVPTNGLIAYYPFNGNANDESGNGNNGTVNGATLSIDRFGTSNAAYDFNGISNSIDCGTATSLVSPSIFTYSAWIKNTNNISNSQKIIISSYNGGLNGNLLSSSNSVTGDFRIHNGSNQADAFTNVPLNINNWYHLVAIKDNTTIKIYIDNVLSQITDITNFNYTPNLYSPFTIGNEGWDNMNALAFQGKIDDVGVWNRVLTQQEISNLYNGNPNAICNIPQGNLANGLVAYYPFCGNANDVSVNANNGIVNGATLINDRFGNLNSAYKFNGQGQNIKVSTINNSYFENDFTVSMWCKFSDFFNDYEHLIYGENQFIVINGNGQAYNSSTSKVSGYQGVFNNNNLRRTPYLETLSHLNTETYYYITYIKENNIVSLYVNGILETTIATNNTFALPLGNYIEFGSGFTETPNYSFNGVIDDIGIWNRALTQLEIINLFNYNLKTNSFVNSELQISVYPNPTNSKINIDCGNQSKLIGSQIKITNTLGQEIYHSILNRPVYEISLGSIATSGLYFVSIIDNDGKIITTKKIILQ